jgi:hypothetical protein
MATTTADRLLDAHVAHVLAALAGERLDRSVHAIVEELWAAASRTRLDEVVTAEDVTRVVAHVLATVPGSVTASTMLEAWTDVALDGPPVETTPQDLLDRDLVAALLGEVLAAREVVTDGGRLDRLAESPAVGALASRFISRVVMEAVQANRAVAERIPGVGSVLSFGTSAASKVAGVADRPLQAMGDTAGKGAAIAARRLNKVVLETLDDPVFAAAVMEVWDLAAGEPLGAVEDEVRRAGLHRIVGLVQEAVVGAAATPQAEAAVAAAVDAFLAVYGEHPVTTLVEELGMERDVVLAEAQALAPRVVGALQSDGTLEAAIRARLQPFYASAAVAAILADRSA